MSPTPRASPDLRGSHRRTHGAACLLGLLTVLTLPGCGSPPGRAGGDATRESPPVEAVVARLGALPLEERVSGRVRARNQVGIRPEINARIEEVLVRSGESVTQGQPLVRLEDDRLRERLRQAEASLRLARGSAAEARARVSEIEARVTRTRQLIRDKLVSQLELETLEAQLDAARARAEQAEARVDEAEATSDERRADLSKAVIRAPIAGRVGRRDAEPGMLVNPSVTLFLIGDFDELIVEIPLTEAMLSRVAEGTPVQIASRHSGSEPLAAEISRISPFLESESLSTVAEIDLDNEDGPLQPGMFVTVRVLYGQSERATLIPTSAVWEDTSTGIQGVFRILESEGLTEPETAPGPGSLVPAQPRPVTFVPVEILAEGRGRLGIRGIEPGQWVVVVGQHLLQELRQVQEAAGSVPIQARVRPTTWEKVLELQDLQREDVLRSFLERQRIVARHFGARIPEDPDAVDQLLAGPPAGDPTSGN